MILKHSHRTIKSIIRRSGKPLDISAIRLRWTDVTKPLDLQRDLDDMVKLGLLQCDSKGYYSLVSVEVN